MDEKELLLKEIGQMIADSTKESAKKADVEAQIKKVNDMVEKMNLDNDGIKELKKSVDQLIEDQKENNLQLKAIKEDGIQKQEVVNFRTLVEKAILEKKDLVLTEKNDDNGKRLSLKDYFTEKGNKNTPVFTLKSAVDMLQSEIVQNNVGLLRLTELDPNRVSIPLAIYPNVLNYFKKKQLNKPTMSLLVVYTYVDGVATKPEGDAAAKSSFLFKTVEFKAFNVSTFFTLSDETLDDLGEALDEINLVAPDKIKEVLNTKILSAAGNDSSDIAGILVAGKHTAFSAAAYAASVPKANIIDLIAKAKLAVKANKYIPNAVLLNPVDVDNLAALKDALDNSITDRRIRFDAIGNPVSICGMVIFESTAITSNQAVVLDLNQTMIGIRKDMTMEIGYNAADFTEGQKTVILKMRVAFGVRDAAAVMHIESISADVATINLSVA